MEQGRRRPSASWPQSWNRTQATSLSTESAPMIPKEFVKRLVSSRRVLTYLKQRVKEVLTGTSEAMVVRIYGAPRRSRQHRRSRDRTPDGYRHRRWISHVDVAQPFCGSLARPVLREEPGAAGNRPGLKPRSVGRNHPGTIAGAADYRVADHGLLIGCWRHCFGRYAAVNTIP